MTSDVFFVPEVPRRGYWVFRGIFYSFIPIFAALAIWSELIDATGLGSVTIETLLLLLYVLFIWGAIHIRVSADTEGITYRNLGHFYTIKYSDIRVAEKVP